jgi:hypothetical protein
LETATPPLYTPSNVLLFTFANCKHRRTNFAAYRKHHSRSEGRDCKIEPGGPVVGGYTYKGAESSTKEHSTTETHNVSGGQEKNRSGTAGTVGKNQGSKKGVVRCFEISGVRGKNTLRRTIVLHYNNVPPLLLSRS